MVTKARKVPPLRRASNAEPLGSPPGVFCFRAAPSESITWGREPASAYGPASDWPTRMVPSLEPPAEQGAAGLHILGSLAMASTSLRLGRRMGSLASPTSRSSAAFSKVGQDLIDTLGDLRQAQHILGEVPGASIQLGGDANPKFRRTTRSPNGQPEAMKSFDLEVTHGSGASEVSRSPVWRHLLRTSRCGSGRSPKVSVMPPRKHAATSTNSARRRTETWSPSSSFRYVGEIEVAHAGGTKSDDNFFDGLPALLATQTDHELVNRLVLTDSTGQPAATCARQGKTWSKL